jgi:SAM-dependent methyltransferase
LPLDVIRLAASLDTDRDVAADVERLRDHLRDAGYATAALANLARAESADEFLSNTGVYSLYEADRFVESATPLSLLGALFLLSAHVPRRSYETLPANLRAVLDAHGLVGPAEGDPSKVRARALITEYAGSFFLSDRLFENRGGGDFAEGDGADAVMPIHCSSLELRSRIAVPANAKSLLDVGCGSGCQAILLKDRFERIVGFDVNPRAPAYSKVNAHLNSARHLEFTTGDCFTWRDGTTYDFVLHNANTEEVGVRFVAENLSPLLSAGGVCQEWTIVSVEGPDGDVMGALRRRIPRLDETFDVAIRTIEPSPFRLTRKSIAEGRVPFGSLLIESRAEEAQLLARLKARRVVDVCSVVLTIRARGATA